MTPGHFHLGKDPWIDCQDNHGHYRTLGLEEVLEHADTLTLAVANPLLEAAITRLVTALAYAAGAAPADTAEYAANIAAGRHPAAAALAHLREHDADLDLGGDRPFGQDPTLRPIFDGGESVQPAICLDMRAALDRPLLADDRGIDNAPALSPADAAAALLVHQTWCMGGKLRVKAHEFAEGAAAGSGSASPLNGRVVLTPMGRSFAETLMWRLVPATGGDMQFGYRPRPATSFASEAEALSFLPRRVLLGWDTDGNVDRVVLIQGQRYSDHDPDVSAPGWSDVVVTSKARKCLSGAAITAPGDAVPVLANLDWREPVPDTAANLVAYVRAVGVTPPPMVATSMVPQTRGQKKAEKVRQATIPGAAIADPGFVAAAAHVVALRRELPDTLRDVGASLLHDATSADRWLAQTQTVGFRSLASTPLAGVAQTRTLMNTLAPAANPESGDRHQGNGESPAPTQEGDVESMSRFEDDIEDDIGVGDRTTFDDVDDHSTVAQNPARHTLRRLAGYQRHHKDVVNDLRRAAGRFDLATPAIIQLTKGMPEEHIETAAMVGVLWSVWHQGQRAPVSGAAPLARLARSFGSNKSFGPGHAATESAIRRAVKTPRKRMLTALLPLVRYARSQQKSINWRELYQDLLVWDSDKAVRTVWSLQFYDNRPLPEIKGIFERVYK